MKPTRKQRQARARFAGSGQVKKHGWNWKKFWFWR